MTRFPPVITRMLKFWDRSIYMRERTPFARTQTGTDAQTKTGAQTGTSTQTGTDAQTGTCAQTGTGP